MRHILKKTLNNFELYICQVMLASFVVILFIDVVLRNIFHYSIPWGSEYSVYANVWFAYFGASYAAYKNLHNRITTQFMLFPEIVKQISLTLSDIAWIIFNVVFLYYSYEFVFVRANKFWMSQTLHIPMKWIYIILPIGFTLITIRVIQTRITELIKFKRKEI